MSLRHITGSSKVVTFLDHLGHCVSHSTLLELTTAMCDSVKENDSNLKSGAVKQAVITKFHSYLQRIETNTCKLHATH